MNELRKIKKEVKRYQTLLIYDQEEARRNKNAYMADIDLLNTFVESYIDAISKVFEEWCIVSCNVFETSTSNIFLKIKRNIDMKIVTYYLNKVSKELSEAGKVKTQLKEIEVRFKQYKFLSD